MYSKKNYKDRWMIMEKVLQVTKNKKNCVVKNCVIFRVKQKGKYNDE